MVRGGDGNVDNTYLMAWRRGFAGLGAASTFVAGAAYYYRPDPSEGELLEKHSAISRRIKSPKNRCDDATEPDPLLLQAATCAVTTSVAAVSRLVMLGLNNTRLHRDARHEKLVDLVRNRPAGVPLLTVANHSSTLDDPALVAVMLPWSVLLRPSLMRWSICSQEICFETAAIASFFGAGKVMEAAPLYFFAQRRSRHSAVGNTYHQSDPLDYFQYQVLPIERGGGLDQKLLLNFSRKLAAGGWCHVFPEGKTVQTGSIGGRPPPGSHSLGRLKWGVGKIVAHAPRTPRIIPFFHTGMQNLVAEDPATKDVLPTHPRFYNDITLRVGNEIDVSDLISDHEGKHGALWKYSAAVSQGGADDERRWSSSSTEERTLYSAIARRIETALEQLEQEARAELGDAYPAEPFLVASGAYRTLLAKKQG